LNDIDLVVEDFASIPESLTATFLAHHVHADASEGKTLLQLVHEPHAIRIDFFRAFGSTLTRAAPFDDHAGALHVLSVEDLVARTTALVCGRLQRGERVDVKHATAFARLRGLGRPERLAAAWNDHRQRLTGTLDDASRDAARLLAARPDLVVVESYSGEAAPCDRCRAHGLFRPAPAARIVEILGYC
jgi:hypothetical protein